MHGNTLEKSSYKYSHYLWIPVLHKHSFTLSYMYIGTMNSGASLPPTDFSLTKEPCRSRTSGTCPQTQRQIILSPLTMRSSHRSHTNSCPPTTSSRKDIQIPIGAPREPIWRTLARWTRRRECYSSSAPSLLWAMMMRFTGSTLNVANLATPPLPLSSLLPRVGDRSGRKNRPCTTQQVAFTAAIMNPGVCSLCQRSKYLLFRLWGLGKSWRACLPMVVLPLWTNL